MQDKVYSAWTYIKQRCLNPKSDNYATYGGRGIKLHPAWQRDFTAFAAELGEPPSDRHTVERKDNSKGYIPGNLKWALPVEQSRNRRTNHWINIDGTEACITDWCRFTGVNVSTAINRMKHYNHTPAQAVGLERKS